MQNQTVFAYKKKLFALIKGILQRVEEQKKEIIQVAMFTLLTLNGICVLEMIS